MLEEKILFERELERTSLFMKYVGIDVNYDQKLGTFSFIWHIRKRRFYLMNFCCLTSGATSVFFILTSLSIQVILGMAPCMTFSYLGDMKSFSLLYYEKELYDIINILRSLQSLDKSEGKADIIDDFVNRRMPFLDKANKMLLFMCATGVVSFAVGPIIVVCYLYWSTNEIHLFLPYTVWYPFDEYSYRWYPFAYIHQIWGAWVGVFFIYSPDRLFYTICIFLNNQFRSLQFDLQKIGPTFNKDKESFNKEIKILVHRHRELIRCVDLLNVVYGKSTLFNVVSSSFIICLTGLNVMIIENIFMMTPFAAVLSLESIQVYLFCYYGDLITRSSVEVSDALYNSEWYKLDNTSKKCILFMMTCAQKPCKITAYGYSDINLMTFAKIMSSAWSYFTLLKTMYSQRIQS